MLCICICKYILIGRKMHLCIQLLLASNGFYINPSLGLVLVTRIRTFFYKWGPSLLHSRTNETNTSNVKTRQAWQMALSLFNGVVKSEYDWKTPFRRVTECDSIKSWFPCRVTCKHLFCDRLARHDSWRLPVTVFTAEGTELLRPWTHLETATEELLLFIDGSRELWV